ncbi:MAG: hypothetical protein ABSG96_22740 [Terracidiphilus sp.]|jgi:hypothetical protein
MPDALTVYLHFPCFDGVVSAVLACEYLERKHGWKTMQVVPVNYSERTTWVMRDLTRPAAVVDFLYHPQADFWADHHQTTFLTPEIEARFQREKSANMLYDPKAQSCAEVIWRKSYRLLREPRFREMVDWAHRIDGARYDSVEEAVLGDRPALQISFSLMRNSSPEYCSFLVEELRAKSLKEVAGSRQVSESYQSVRKSIQLGQKRFQRASRVEKDGIVVFDVRQADDTLLSRYAPYLAYPKARYSVGIVESVSGTKITAMRNPWRHFKSVPLGQIFSQYGGGGHQRVASVLVKDAREAKRTLGFILNDLRNAASGTKSSPKEAVPGD